VEIGDRLTKLLITLEKEFETHYVIFHFLFNDVSRELLLIVDYSLANKVYLISIILPKRQLGKCFKFITKDFIDRIYGFINTTALSYNSQYGKQRRR
jgi:hypothetical protein